MRRVLDWFLNVFDAVTHWMGFDRIKQSVRAEDLADKSRLGRIVYFFRPVLMGLALIYVILLFTRLTFINGDDLGYPQRVMVMPDQRTVPGQPIAGGEGCAPSELVNVTAYVVDVLVNQNVWAPGDPQFKIGFFGVLPFEPTPWFDNKASWQLGAIRAARRMSIELTDILGRARGTSAADRGLQAARANMQWNERAWIVNPFDDRVPLLSTSAAQAYRSAMRELHGFNGRLAACNATFDIRTDNLFQLLDRIANDLGAMTDELTARSKAEVWDVNTRQFVRGTGNDRGFFDFRADNLFWEASGLVWAYHGILQGVRADFQEVIVASNLTTIWNRMEGHLADAAALKPLIVSNGRSDSLFTPDHLAVMAASTLRAWANIYEMREIINR